MSVEILNCHSRFAGQCPNQWENLTETADPRIRSCEVCKHQVRLCKDLDEALYIARDGRRVAWGPLLSPAVASTAASPSVSTTWQDLVPKCFGMQDHIWASGLKAQANAREMLFVAIESGARMREILSEAEKYLRSCGVREEHLTTQLERIRSMEF